MAAVITLVTAAQRGRGDGPGSGTVSIIPTSRSTARTATRAVSTVSGSQCGPASTRQATRRSSGSANGR